jgi:hypothetical protein
VGTGGKTKFRPTEPVRVGALARAHSGNGGGRDPVNVHVKVQRQSRLRASDGTERILLSSKLTEINYLLVLFQLI